MAGVYAPASPCRGLPLAHRDQDGETQTATASGARGPAAITARRRRMDEFLFDELVILVVNSELCGEAEFEAG
jgi:hypothetical protein